MSARFSTAAHEVGHALVAHHFGIPVGNMKINIDGDVWAGSAAIGNAGHLPLIEQMAVCVAGLEAQDLLNCEPPPAEVGGAFGDYGKIQTLFDEYAISKSDQAMFCQRARSRARASYACKVIVSERLRKNSPTAAN